MRINAGTFKGFPILTGRVPHTRPTSDKVKQAIFNILGGTIPGKTVLDLFSGFGSLGLEALSRGASRVVFVDSNPRCTRIIKKNLEKIGVGQPAAMVLTQDVLGAIKRLEKEGASFWVILSDAPYDKEQVNSKILNRVAKSAILQAGSLLILQHSKHDMLVSDAKNLEIIRSYPYGETVVTTYRKVS